MTEPTLSFAHPAALAELRRIYLERATGVLELTGEHGEVQLHFVTGELYLDPEHPLAGRAHSSPAVLAHLLPEVTDLRFLSGTAHIRLDLLGPLPLAPVVMAATVLGCDEFRLLKQLGGEERKFVAPKTEDPQEKLPDLDPHEAFFVSRLEQPVRVKELLRQSSLERRQALEKLCRLLAVGLIRPEEETPKQEREALLSPALLQKFSQRILDSLERTPVELEAAEHRERLAELMGQLGELNHFELLGVGMSSPGELVYDSYMQLARVVHPVHAVRLGLSGREGGLELLLERATEAYLTLSDGERSREYLLKSGAVAEGDELPSGAARQQEEKSLADHHFRTAQSLALREDYHFAIELLNQAVRADPRAEYYALLGECQSKNPQWINKAIFSYLKAVQLAPDDAALHAKLGESYAAAGELAKARLEFKAALELVPGLPGAAAGLAGLGKSEGKVGTKTQEKSSWLGSLLSRFGKR